MKLSLLTMSAVSLLTMTILYAFGLPADTAHLSFIPAWLLFMLIAGLPLTFVDAIIIRRTQQLPLQGLVPMTRDADVKTTWRLLAPLSMICLVLLMGYNAQYAKHYVAATEQIVVKESLAYLLLFFAVGFAWVGMRRLLSFVGILVPVALAIHAISAQHTWQLQLLTTDQWQLVAMSALFCSVGSLGVYAWLMTFEPLKGRASQNIMPLWATQTVIGVLTLIVGQTTGNVDAAIYMPCAIFALAIYAETVATQLQAQGISKPIALGGVLLASIVASYLANYQVYDPIFQSLWLVTIIGLTVFMGWMMKISHVRKALNFSSEGVYNLWRVAIRLLVPLISVWLLISLFL